MHILYIVIKHAIYNNNKSIYEYINANRCRAPARYPVDSILSERERCGELAAIVYAKILHTKILGVNFPGELPSCWGISPLENESLTESNP